MLKKIYVEITNKCNLKCSFCHGTKRTPGIMTCEQFEIIAKKLQGKTGYLYLHVMGEPLTHPELAEIIDISHRLGFKTCITTNGTLLEKQQNILLERAEKLHKISISLHSFEANAQERDFLDYIRTCIDFQKKAGDAGIITVLRLWNLDGMTPGQNQLNTEIIDMLHGKYPGEWTGSEKSPKLAERCFLEFGEKFEWPDESACDYGERRFCMGLRDQAGVLCDGTVIPCCLDSEGTISLGNLFENDFDSIISSARAVNIKNGFSDNKAVEPLCRRCGYSTRFKQ